MGKKKSFATKYQNSFELIRFWNWGLFSQQKDVYIKATNVILQVGMPIGVPLEPFLKLYDTALNPPSAHFWSAQMKHTIAHQHQVGNISTTLKFHQKN
jgi:hypothetical protein